MSSLPEPRHEHAGDLEVSFRGRAVVRPLYLAPVEARLFREWLKIMRRTDVPYALGGAYAHYAFTGVWRDSKDMDVFVRPQDVRTVLDAFAEAGYDTELRDPRWLAKVHSAPHLLDILFAVRHMTRLRITDEWLRTAVAARFLDVPTRILRPEEIVATKAYIANRDRFDGADILHLIRALQGEVDWQRLVDLLEGDEEIVLWHLVLFALVYPMHREWLPQGAHAARIRADPEHARPRRRPHLPRRRARPRLVPRRRHRVGLPRRRSDPAPARPRGETSVRVAALADLHCGVNGAGRGAPRPRRRGGRGRRPGARRRPHQPRPARGG